MEDVHRDILEERKRMIRIKIIMEIRTTRERERDREKLNILSSTQIMGNLKQKEFIAKDSKIRI